MKGLLVKLVRSDDGQDLIEYGLLVGSDHRRRRSSPSRPLVGR